jgi:predicted transcriptional regulator
VGEVELDETLQALTAQIVSAYVANHNVESPAAVIREVYAALSTVGEAVAEAAAPTPAVDPKKSVFRDYIVCLEDGQKLKMLKRHLATSYGMTPEEYKQKWKLPHDYPIVAPSYAETRSQLAKKIGLGRKPGAAKGARKKKVT